MATWIIVVVVAVIVIAIIVAKVLKSKKGNTSGIVSSKNNEEWYYSHAGSEAYGKAWWSDNKEGALTNYYIDYLESLPNIKEAKKEKCFIDTRILGSLMASVALKAENEYYEEDSDPHSDGNHKGYVNAFDESKNEILYFAKRLNHSFHGRVAKIVIQALADGKASVEDKWLYDKELFKQDPNATDEALYKRVKAYIEGLDIEDMLDRELGLK